MNSSANPLNMSHMNLSDELPLVLDTHSFVPYYEQIVDQVRNLVRHDRLKEGQVFYSEGEIARILGISKMPVRQAFQKLRSEGLLVISRGRKPVIGPGHVPWDFRQLRGFSEEMMRRGLVPSARLLEMRLEEPEEEISQALKLASGEKVFRLKRLRFVNEEAVAVVTSYLPARIFPDMDKHDLERHSLYDIVERVYKRKLQWAEEVIGAISVSGDDAGLLEASPGSPVLLIKETTFDVQKIPIEYSISLLRGDRYTASVISVRKK